MIQNIHYIIHLVLQSKYKIVINIIIYTLIYLSINNVQIASCMMEGNEIPQIAEAKEQASHQVRALKKEITDFAGTQIELLEEINKQEEKIKELTKALKTAEWVNNANQTALESHIADIKLLEKEKIRVSNEIEALPNTVRKEDILHIIRSSSSRIFDEQERSGRIRLGLANITHID